jgi:hypothetical protein
MRHGLVHCIILFVLKLVLRISSVYKTKSKSVSYEKELLHFCLYSIDFRALVLVLLRQIKTGKHQLGHNIMKKEYSTFIKNTLLRIH